MSGVNYVVGQYRTTPDTNGNARGLFVLYKVDANSNYSNWLAAAKLDARGDHPDVIRAEFGDLTAGEPMPMLPVVNVAPGTFRDLCREYLGNGRKS